MERGIDSPAGEIWSEGFREWNDTQLVKAVKPLSWSQVTSVTLFFSRSLTLPQSNFACQQGKMSSSTPSKPKSSTPSKPKSSTPSKPTPVTLTLRQKAEVLKEQEKGLSCRKIAVKYGVGKTQIGEIFKRKREILDALENNAAPDAKRLKTNQH